MANTVDNMVLQSDGVFYRHRYLVLSDGTTAMSDVVVIDKSTLTHHETGLEPTALDLIEFDGQAGGSINSIVLEWDHTTDDEIIAFGVNGLSLAQNEWGRFADPRSDGATGDVVVTTNGLSTGAWFMFVATWRLRAR